jgi:hypothetical protein
MTDTTQLDALIAAVEAGIEHKAAIEAKNIAKASIGTGTYWPAHDAMKAYHGSLDAALALHEALLPEWHPLVGQNVHHHYWHANVQRIGEDGLIECQGCTDQATPARAWLLAILRAYRAQVAV